MRPRTSKGITDLLLPQTSLCLIHKVPLRSRCQCELARLVSRLRSRSLTELTRQITPPTKNGHAPPPIESRKSSQSVNPYHVWHVELGVCAAHTPHSLPVHLRPAHFLADVLFPEGGKKDPNRPLGFGPIDVGPVSGGISTYLKLAANKTRVPSAASPPLCVRCDGPDATLGSPQDWHSLVCKTLAFPVPAGVAPITHYYQE